MNSWTRSVLITLGAGWLSGCALAPPAKRFTLEVDLPAQFRFIGAANYRSARYELCTLPQRRGKRPERKIFIADYKPVAERVSYEFPLTETIEGCPTVLRSVEFTLYAKWGELDTDVGGSFAAISFADPIESERVAAMPESGVQEFFGQCMWFFRTAGPEHAIRKLLECNALDTKGKRQETRPGGVAQRELLPGKKVRLTLSVTDEEAPAFQDTWLAVPGGWRRCRGKSFEDLSGYCGSNTTDFKPITMPDGRVCDVYPTCN